MIKVLYVLNNVFKKGGTEAVVLNYYKYVNSENVKIDFAIHATKEEYDSNEVVKKLTEQGTKVYRITPRYQSIRKNREDLRAAICAGYDIVHTHTDAVGASVLKIAKDAGIKARVAHSHNTDFPVKPDSLKNRIKLILLEKNRKDIVNQANYFMACSKAAGKWLFGANNANQIYLLNNAIDISKYEYSESARKKLREELGLSDDNFVLGNVGRFNHQKNHLFLLKVFKEVYEKYPNARLLLVGDGELKAQMQSYIAENNLTDGVIFYGTTSHVGRVLSMMDVFVFPSTHEGLSVALVEAQANGLHCIVTDSEKVTKDSDLTGQITWVKTDSVQPWVDAILTGNHDRNSHAGEGIAANNYDLKQEANKLTEFYKSIVK